MIEATVDMDMSDNHEYVIKPTFDEELTSMLLYSMTIPYTCVYIMIFGILYNTSKSLFKVFIHTGFILCLLSAPSQLYLLSPTALASLSSFLLATDLVQKNL